MKKAAYALSPLLLFPALLPLAAHGRYSLFPCPVLQIGLVLAAILICYVSLSAERPLDAKSSRGVKYGLMLGIFIVAYFLLFSILSYVKYTRFGYMGSDLTKFSQSFWTTIHGGPCFYNSAEGHHFGNHFSPFLFLLLPVYYALPSPVTLLIFKTGAIAASGWPLFLLGRKFLGAGYAFCLTIGYLLYWPVLNQNLFEFYELHFVPFLVLWMLYFFHARRYGPFILFMGLSLSLREEMGLIVLMAGFCALFLRRGARWTAVPLAAGGLWLALCFFLVIPHFSETGGYVYGQYFSRAAASGAEAQGEGRLLYLYLLFFPLCIFLPLLSWEWLLCLPLLLGLLVTSWKPARMVQFHYHLALAPFLWASIIGAFDLFRRKNPLSARILLILLMLFVIQGSLIIYHYERPFVPLGSGGDREGGLRRLHYLTEAVALIPPEASCLVPEYAAPQLAHRKEIYFRTRYLAVTHPDFILLDDMPLIQKACNAIKAFISGPEGGNYRLIYRQGTVKLYEKTI